MLKKITKVNMFKIEPVRSILNLFWWSQNKQSLYFREIYYILSPKNYIDQLKISNDLELQHNIKRMKKKFDDILNKLYSPIVINGEETESLIKKGCITSRDQLRYYLKVLGEKRLDVIVRRGKGKKARYSIKKDIYEEKIKLQNQEALDLFPKNLIIECSVDSYTRKDVLYGMPTRVFNVHKKLILDSLKEIRKNVKILEKIKNEDLVTQVKWRIQEFIEELSSKKIKVASNKKIREAFRENGYNFWVFTQYVLIYKSNWNAQEKWNIGTERPISKSAFYEGMGWISEISGEKYPISRPEYVPSPVGKNLSIVLYGKELYEFFCDAPDTLTSKREADIYCKRWSEHFFLKNYNFSLEEIKEAIDWGWDNRDIFYEFYPLSIAFSTYKEFRMSTILPYFQHLIRTCK